MKKDSRLIPILVLCLCTGVLAAYVISGYGDGSRRKQYQTTEFAMGTVVDLTVYGDGAKEAAEELLSEIHILENSVLSWREEGSEIAELNHNYIPGQAYPVSQELAEYLIFAEQVADASDGLLDITIRPLADIWGIEDGKKEIPEQTEIDGALANVDYQAIHVIKQDSENSGIAEPTYMVCVDREGISIDLGAIGKGIACDRIADCLLERKCSGCAAVGGSIVVSGEKQDGTPWVIGIRDPRGTYGEVMGVLNLKLSAGTSRFVSTSGDYEKYFIQDGRRYHHILNPHTGYPASTGIISATVICDNGALSDALSTVCILAGREQAFEILKAYGAEGILIDENLQVYVTEGIRDEFSIRNENFQIASQD